MRATAVAAGSNHSLVLADDGEVYGAGSNVSGQLTGPDSSVRELTPLTGLPTGVAATATAGGHQHSLVVGDDDVVYGTGKNAAGQLTGNGARRILAPLTGLPGGVQPTAVAAGRRHSLVVGGDGQVYGTGRNHEGQLTGDDRKHRNLTALTGLPAGVEATGIGAGTDTSLVVGDDGVAYGAGSSRVGRLTGADSPRRTLTPLVWGLTDLVPPGITGTPKVGRTLTAEVGTWWPTPNSYERQWYRDGEKVPGSTAASHRVVSDDAFKTLQVRETARLPGFVPSRARSLRVLATRRTLPTAVAVAAVSQRSLVIGTDGLARGTGDNPYSALTGTVPRKRLSLIPLAGQPAGVPATAVAGGTYHSLVLGATTSPTGPGGTPSGRSPATIDSRTP